MLSSLISVSQMSQVQFNPDPVPQTMNQCILVNESNLSTYIPNVSALECLEFNNAAPTNVVIETAPNVFDAKAGKSIHLLPNVHIKANAHLKIDSDPDFTLAWYAPNTVGVASHHEKMEIGLRLSDQLQAEIDNFFDNDSTNGGGINPYNRHALDLQMTFYINGNPIDRVDAFYYIPQKIDTLSNGFVDDTTTYNFRFRHSPRELANYTAEIELFVNGVLWSTMDFGFTVIPSTNKGYLEQGKYGKHMRYAKTKESFFGVGQVIPWARYPNWYNWNEPAGLDLLTEDMTIPFEVLNDAGGNFSRIVSATWSLDFEAEVLGNYTPKRGQAWYLDKLTDFCTEEEVYFIYCMKVHSPFEVKYDSLGNLANSNQSGWGYNPYNDSTALSNQYASEPAIGITNVNEFYSNPLAMSHYQNYIRYIVSRWGYASSIAGWQVMSEIDNTTDYRDNEATQIVVKDWVHEMLKFIATDQYDRHLRSVSTMGRPGGAYTNLNNINIYESEYLNFGGLHQYTIQDIITNPIDGYGNFRNRSVLGTYEATRNIATGSNGDKNLKEVDVDPNIRNNVCIFDEHGISANRYVEGGDNSNVGDATTGINRCQQFNFHNDLWATICSGAAVAGLEWTLAQDTIRQAQWYNDFPYLQQFFATIDFENVEYTKLHYQKNRGGLYIANRWPWKRKDIDVSNHTNKPAKDYDKETLLEAITTVSADRTQGFGWCHNRSHYWWNLKEESSSCIHNMVYPDFDPNDEWQSQHLFRPKDDDLVDVPQIVFPGFHYFKIQDVKPLTTYVIRFYDTRTGNWLPEQEKISSADKELKVFPLFMLNHPDLAYTIRQKGTTWNSPQVPLSQNNSSSIRTNGETPIQKNSIFVVYPNPNNGNFVIQSSGEAMQEIFIADELGKEIARISNVNQMEYLCDLNLAEGAYLVSVRTGEKVEVVHVIVVK